MILPTPQELKKKYPLSRLHEERVAYSRMQTQKIFSRDDRRFVIVTGPCSIHDPSAAIDYAKKLCVLAKKVQKNCLLVMRVYVEKSRSTTGWRGLLHDPYLNGSDDILTGLEISRKLLLDIVQEGIPIAVEFVDPLIAPYIDDLVSWGFVGARSCSSQPHRQLASFFSFPIGFKNSVDGDIISAVEGVICASSPHTFLTINSVGKLCAKKSSGNPFSHLVLRGGRNKTNYDPHNVQSSINLLKNAEVFPKVMIDCSHGNSQKNDEKQKEVFYSVLDQVKKGNSHIMGVMLESNLDSGSQPIYPSSASLKYGISVTDPCLDFPSTEELISSADRLLSSEEVFSTASTGISPSS